MSIQAFFDEWNLPVMVFYSVYIIIFVKVNKRVLLYLLSYILRLLTFKRSSGILYLKLEVKQKELEWTMFVSPSMCMLSDASLANLSLKRSCNKS